MSQKATRKSQNAASTNEEKEKVDTPVKEMKKKIAANAEKDKQAAEKAEKNDSADKSKQTDKPDKNGDKADTHKDKPSDKKTDSKDKTAEKKTDAQSDNKTDKQDKVAEKKQDKKSEKPAEKKAETPAEKEDKTKEKGAAVNGSPSHTNGAVNGAGDAGTVSDGSDVELLDEDEAFPELTYDESGTDAEDAAPAAASRSRTRRSQVKATKTPETPAPRPASDAQDDSKESKILKLKDDSTASDRKLRSADSPKPDAKKLDKKTQETEEDKKSTKKDADSSKSDGEKKEQKDGNVEKDKLEVEVIEVESSDNAGPRTRARVSPYSRTRLDRTVTSVMADYTGNNSTMEMDITESSVAEDPSLNDSAYLRGLRGIRGRSSYKTLSEIKLTNPNAGKPRPTPTVPIRPLGTVVGRKRKPSPSPPRAPAGVEAAAEASEELFLAHGKRMKLFDRLAAPWRRSLTRRAADIVGINTDLPMTAPVASTSFATFDPETIKPAPVVSPGEPLATPLPTPVTSMHDRDGKRCVVM